ncbi:MAG: hypothetical protein KDD62_16490, partial [Bdellovibrionales bacterium]|nr:hypothetical protein [Bdellovibrionales bacterium]
MIAAMAWSGVHRSFIAQALVSCALLIAFSGRLLARRRARDERSLTHGFALLVVTLAGYVSLDVVDGRRLAELLERPWILGLYLLVAAVISYAHHLRGRAMRAGRDVVTKESLRFNRRRLAALTLLLALAPAAWTTIELARRWGDTRVVWDVETGERVASVAPERTFTSTLGWTADARVAFQDAEATYLAAIDGGALTRIAGRHALTPDGRW